MDATGVDERRLTRYGRVAASAGRWIVAAAISSEGRRAWPAVAGRPATLDPSLLGAEAGIVLFLLDLWRMTGESDASTAAHDAVLQMAALGSRADRWGLYDGLSGMALAARRAADELHDDELAAAADLLLCRLLDTAELAPEGGLEWPALPPPDGRGPWTELYRGNAGIGLVLLELGRVDEAIACGIPLAARANRVADGSWWRSRPDDENPAPNIAHGTAGIGYFLATLAGATGDDLWANHAIDAGRYLLSLARTTDGTCAVHHHERGGRDLYSLGWCSGPPGLGCLFIRLHQITRNPEWLDWAERAARTVLVSGLPSRLYPGFWDNVGQCCGSAGVADFMLGLGSVTGNHEWTSFAFTVLDDICDRATTDDAGARWHNIDHRNPDPELPAQTGYMQGAAGVATALLRGARASAGDSLGPWLPPWPFEISSVSRPGAQPGADECKQLHA